MIRKTKCGRELRGRVQSETDGEWGNFKRDNQSCIFTCVSEEQGWEDGALARIVQKGAAANHKAGSWRTMALNSRDMFVDSGSPAHGEVPLFTDMDNSTVFLWWSLQILFSMTFINSEELYKRGYYQLKNDFALSPAWRGKREYSKALALKAD